MNRIACLLILLAAIPAAGATLFDEDSVLEITLRGPLSSVIADKRRREERSFTFIAGGRSFDVAVRIRGNSRVTACAFPPLRLDFEPQELAGSPLEGEDKLKLVTHCRNRSERAQDAVLNEFAAYRIFNLLSERSYRVRLLRIRYEDTDGKQSSPEIPPYGFLIESDVGLARRLGGTVEKIDGLRFSELDMEQAATISIFQYLIGNKDWSFVKAENDDSCCHNLDLLRVNGALVPLPYDFDLAAMTRARYRHSARLNLSTRREYSGYCRTPTDALAAALERARQRQAQILSALAAVPALDESSRERRVAFVEEFFAEADDPGALLNQFARDCVGSR